MSESFRNAFAISLYLAAASLYGGLPKFVLLEDVTSSFDAGHQNFLVELIRTTFARPGNATGPQVILLSHDTMLEKLFNKAANCLMLDAAQEAGLNTNMVTIVGNFLSHWGTGQVAAYSAPSLLGVMQAIDDYCDCFTFEPTPGAARAYYKTLGQRQ